jgi:hypothetical protein
MRQSLELGKLNKFWEKFNNGEQVLDLILNNKWKYHKDKVKLLISFIKLQDIIKK